MNSEYKYSQKVVVRFSDTDALGHCNNARYFSFMEEARVSFMHHFFPDQKPSEAFFSVPFILAQVDCNFRRPTYFGDTIVVNLGITSIGNKSFKISYQLFNEKNNELVADGSSVQVMYDYKTEQSQELSNDLRNKLQDYFVGDDAN